MNVFVIPSWYPSEPNPHYGIFNAEQVRFLAKSKPDWKFGVSTWGQGDFNKQLWAKDHIWNLSKVTKHNSDIGGVREVSKNVWEYYEPALSWTKKLKKGNLDNIIKASELNFQELSMEHGVPDLIWVQATYPGVFAAKYLSDTHHIPFVAQEHSGGAIYERLIRDLGKMKIEFEECLKSATRLICVSEFQKRTLPELFDRAKVLFNPVDGDYFLPQDHKGDFILVVSRLEHEKGLDILLDAISQIDKLNLKIVGDGSMRKTLTSQCEKLELTHRVSFLGSLDREEVLTQIQSCNFLVLPSRYETFGNVLLEAMACGKPVVATKCGGPNEIVEEKTGILCDPGSKELRQGIIGMIEGRSNFKETEIREAILNKYGIEKWTIKIEQLFKETVETSS